MYPQPVPLTRHDLPPPASQMWDAIVTGGSLRQPRCTAASLDGQSLGRRAGLDPALPTGIPHGFNGFWPQPAATTTTSLSPDQSPDSALAYIGPSDDAVTPSQQCITGAPSITRIGANSPAAGPGRPETAGQPSMGYVTDCGKVSPDAQPTGDRSPIYAILSTSFPQGIEAPDDRGAVGCLLLGAYGSTLSEGRGFPRSPASKSVSRKQPYAT